MDILIISENPKCKEHLKAQLDILNLKQNAPNPRICFKCQVEQNIDNSQVIPLNLLLNTANEEYLPNYPLLTNPDLISNVQELSKSIHQAKIEIEDFFLTLKTDINSLIEKSEKQAKEFFTKLIGQEKKTCQVFQEVQSLENFKKLFSQHNKTKIDQELKNFISNQWEKADSNTKKIESELNSFQLLYSQFSQEILEEVSSQIKIAFSKLKFLKDDGSSNSIQINNSDVILPKSPKQQIHSEMHNNKPKMTTQDTKFIQNFLEVKEFLIYNANNNLAIDIYDMNSRILQTWHTNFNTNQLYYFRLTSQHQDSLFGYFESKACPGVYLSVKEQNILCLSDDKESSQSQIQFSPDGFAQISFKAKDWLQLVTEQAQNSKGQNYFQLKLVQATNPNFFNWTFLEKDKETFKNQRVYIQAMINNKRCRINSITGQRFAQIEPVIINKIEDYVFRAKTNKEGVYSFYQGSGDKCLSSSEQEALFLDFNNKLSEWIVMRNVVSNDYYLMSLEKFYFISFNGHPSLVLENPDIKLGFQTFRIIKEKDAINEKEVEQVGKIQQENNQKDGFSLNTSKKNGIEILNHILSKTPKVQNYQGNNNAMLQQSMFLQSGQEPNQLLAAQTIPQEKRKLTQSPNSRSKSSQFLKKYLPKFLFGNKIENNIPSSGFTSKSNKNDLNIDLIGKQNIKIPTHSKQLSEITQMPTQQNLNKGTPKINTIGTETNQIKKDSLNS